MAIFWLAAVAVAPTAIAESPQVVRDVNVSDFFVPADLGDVSETHTATSAPSAPERVVVLIQDAHANYEAQQHLAAILDRLATRHGLRLVLVEGGAGDVGLAHLRHRGSRESRKRVADDYLKSGILSGEEYLDVVSDHPLILWGVDDVARHDQHYQIYLDVEAAREPVRAELAPLRQAVEQLQAKLTNEPLKTFLAKRAAFDRQTLALPAYLAYIKEESARVGLSLAAFPNLAAFLTIAELEPSIKSEQVNLEQAQAVAALRAKASVPDLTRLAETSKQVKAGDASASAFAQALDALLQQYQIDRAGWPQLSAYLRVVRLKADLRLRELMAEIAAAQEQLADRLAVMPNDANFVKALQGLESCERLISLEWMPADYLAYQREPQRVLVSRWLPVLRAQAERVGVPLTRLPDARALDAQLAKAVKFYDAAHGRDGVMVERALAKLDETGQRLAALIVGGFHADEMREMLLARGLRVVVITPKVGEDDDPARYDEVLKLKFAHRIPTIVAKPRQTVVAQERVR